MTGAEFIEMLQKALTGRISSSSVNDNIRYYQEYIDTQIRTGHKEEEVIKELGDPRLIAKTIIEADKREGRGYGSMQPDYDEVYEDGSQSRADEEEGKNRIPGWVIGFLIVLLIMVAVGIVGSILTTFFPVIIPIICIILVIKLFQKNG